MTFANCPPTLYTGLPLVDCTPLHLHAPSLHVFSCPFVSAFPSTGSSSCPLFAAASCSHPTLTSSLHIQAIHIATALPFISPRSTTDTSPLRVVTRGLMCRENRCDGVHLPATCHSERITVFFSCVHFTPQLHCCLRSPSNLKFSSNIIVCSSFLCQTPPSISRCSEHPYCHCLSTT